MNVLVTGAGGFIGRYLVPALTDKGHRVRAMIRTPVAVDGFGWPPHVEIVHADLREPGRLGSALTGVDAVIHLAAAITGTLDEQRLVTVRGTAHLLQAMVQARVRRLVHASSFAVYDWHQAPDTLDEASPLETRFQERDTYCRSKLEQERLVRDASSRHGMQVTVLRPGFVWGAEQPAIGAIGRVFGPLLLQVGASRELALTYVENCVAVFAQVVDDPRASGQTFNIVDVDRVTAASHTAAVTQLWFRGRFVVPIPYRLLLGGVRLIYPLVRFFCGRRYRIPGLLVPGQLESQFKPLRFSTCRLAKSLQWRAPYSHAQAMERIRTRIGRRTETPRSSSASTSRGIA